MSRRKFILWCLIGFVALLAIAASYFTRFAFERRLARELALGGQRIPVPPPKLVFTGLAVPGGVPFAGVLARMDVDPQTAGQIAAAAKSVFDFRMFRAGNELKIARTLFG
ncbi:MAG: hypothetical protein WBD26_11245, partial [Candidatus Acidiferrales bacterium]